MKVNFLLLWTALLTGCVVVQQAPSETPGVRERASPSGSDNSSDRGSKIQSVSDAIAACNKIQKAQDLPVGCRLEYIDGKPAMFMAFADLQDAENWMGALAEHIAVPYCDSANRSGREAFVVALVDSTDQGKLFRCETWEWGAWFALDSQEETTRTPESVSEAMQACKNIQAANDIPIVCKSTYFEGRPAMLVGFPNQSTGAKWIEAFATYVGVPFCSAANKGNRQAMLLFAITDREIATIYNCETMESSGWFNIGGERI
jgi:hypothetical protein